MARGPSGGVNPDPLTFYWRGRILHLRCDDPLNLYSTPVSILRRRAATLEVDDHALGRVLDADVIRGTQR